jgi:TonB-linked SusC/RagA family outer membrane protein
MLVMKLTSFLLLAGCLQLSAAGLSQTITFKGRGVPLLKVFSAIKKQTGYAVLYNADQLEKARPIDIDASGIPLENFLNQVLKGQPFEYTIENTTIFISVKAVAEPMAPKLPEVSAEPPPIDVSGKIVNDKGEPAAGVYISVKGTNRSTATDAGGKFILNGIDSKAVLVISGVNIETYETGINGRTILDITVRLKLSELSEVVINKGYYTTTRRQNTGSVSKVTSATIEKQPVSNPLAALTGRVAGLDVIQQSGLPGTGFTLRLRGVNSVRPEANSPLIIVDGSPYPSNSFSNAAGLSPLGYVDISPLNSLNPNDIESVEVLKDADATSIYGSRGGNGVILITTKKGKAGKTLVDINLSSGFAKMGSKQKILNTRQYLDMRYEAIRNDGQTIATAPASTVYDLTKWDTTRYTDWQDLILGNTAHYDRAQLSVSGGNDNTSFSFSGSYSKETTIMPIDLSDKKYNGRLSINHRSANKRFTSQFTVTYGMDNNTLPGWSIASFTLSLPPIAPPVYDTAGKLYWGPSDAGYQNPLGRLQERYSGKLSSLVTGSVISYELLKGLRIKANLGYNVVQNTSSSKRGQDFFNPSEWVARGQYLRLTYDMNMVSTTWNVEPQVEWEKKLGPGKLNLIVGSTFQQTKTNGSFLSVQGYADDALMGNPNFGTIRDPYVEKKDYLYNALFGRLNYNLGDKYILNLTARRDGSSRFAPGKRFGNFGAIGAAWLFSEEPFLKNIQHVLSFGKLRASYGTTGNDVIPDYGYMSLYTATSTNFAGAIGLTPVGLANDSYSWETNKKAEVALEFAFLKDRVQFSTSYYHNRSSNQLVNYPLPAFVGFSRVQVNLPAVVQNTGLEFELNTTNIQTSDFSWKTSANLSFPRNKLASYDNLQGSSYANTYVLGHPLTLVKTFDFVRVDPQTGGYVWKNRNGKDTSNAQTLSLADLTVPINVGKDLFGGINNSFQYKGVQLDIFLNFSKQVGPFAYFPTSVMRGGVANLPLDLYERRWKKPGDVTDVPKLFNNPSALTGTTLVGSTYNETYYGSISFVRIKNVALSYTLPATLLKKLKWQTCRVYMQAQNLFTITNYKGWDPENQSNNIPLLRVITAGLQLTF